MQQYGFPDPGLESCDSLIDELVGPAGAFEQKPTGLSRVVDELADALRAKGMASAMATAIAEKHFKVAVCKITGQDPQEEIIFLLEYPEVCVHPSVFQAKEAELERLICQLRRRCGQYVTGWRVWLMALVGTPQSDAGWTSMLPSWSPWTGRAPPVVPQVIQRQ